MIYVFGDCELDSDRHLVRRAGEEQKLEPQAFDVLLYLIEQRGRMVAKSELLDEIWGDRFVSESALTTRIKSARRVVGDDGRAQRIIRTVHGRGYEFVAAIETLDPAEPVATPPSDPTGPSREVVGSGPAPELIGREALIPVLEDELAAARLLTLVGPAGVGKTSVGSALARSAGSRFPDGVWIVELATVTQPDAAIQVIATTLDMKSQQDQSLADTIVEFLGPRTSLLMLDNCEHVIEPISELVEEILRVAPAVTVLATSREALATPSERLWPIDPLPVVLDEHVDAEQLGANPSVRLFVERARAADPHFELSDANAPAVAEICRRLDGIPLAIELAAARQRSLDVADIADRLNERFRLLKAVRRGTEERHQTLQNAVRWSYDLLSNDEQRVFDSLSVFAGCFSLDAADAVFGSADADIDVLDNLGRLVERSMLALRRTDGGSRYEMLETIREFGRGRLGDDETLELHRRHAGHHDGLAERIAESRCGSDEGRWTEIADLSFADLRAAQRFATQSGDVDTAFGMIDRLTEYAMRSMRYEVLAWVGPAMELAGADDHPLHPQMLAVRGYGAWVRGEYELARRLADDALAAIEARGLPPSTTPYRVLGNVGYLTGDIETGLANTARMLDVAIEMGDPSRTTHAAYMHSIAASSDGRLEDARAILADAEEAAGRTNNPTDLASVAIARAFMAEDDDTGLADCRRAVELAGDARNRWMQAFAGTELSGRLLARGELGPACSGLGQVVETWHRSGDWAQLWLTLTHSAVALCGVGADELAAHVIGSTDRHATYATTPLPATQRQRALEAADDLRSRLGDARYDALLAEGASLPVSDVVHRARAGLIAGAAGAPGE